MKSAEQLLKELLIHTKPPAGSAISLTEAADDGSPNWIACIGPMPSEVLDRYIEINGALRKSDPRIDWSAVSERSHGRRHIPGGSLKS